PRLLCPPVRPTVRQEDPGDLGPRARAAARPRLGGQRARAAQRDRAGRDRGDRRDAAGGAPAGRASGRGGHARRPAAGRSPDVGGGGGATHRPSAGTHQRADRRGRGDPRDPPQHPDAEDEGVRVVTGPPPVRVEKALALMPELEALAPLRALLVSIARPDEATVWSSSGPYLTLGKRGVPPDERRRRMPRAAGGRHCQRWRGVAEAEFGQAGATAASEGLGDVAVAQGQWGGAQAWYSRGLRLAEAASDAPHAGRLERQLGVLARKQRDLAA